MPPKSKLTREEQLVQQAVQLFSQGGYRETSLQEITDRLGITRPLFYYYFESKEELLWRIIGSLGDHLLDNARPIAASEAAPRERLSLLVRAHARALLENSDAFRIYFAERHLLQGKRDRRLRHGEDAYLELVAGVIAEGQEQGAFREGAPRLLARFLTGMANSMLRWYGAGGDLSVEELSGLAAELATASLAASSHESR